MCGGGRRREYPFVTPIDCCDTEMWDSFVHVWPFTPLLLHGSGETSTLGDAWKTPGIFLAQKWLLKKNRRQQNVWTPGRDRRWMCLITSSLQNINRPVRVLYP